jgi:gliding motility-associated-like protein
MKKTLVLLALCLTMLDIFATHIVGGEIMYNFVSTNNFTVKYKVSLYLYVDCINGTDAAIKADQDGFLHVFSFDKQTGQYHLYDNNRNFYPLRGSRSDPKTVSDLNYKCIKTKPNACVDKYTFTINIEVPVNDGGYVIAFERCCRNNTINNIFNPQSSGATYWTKIPGVNEITKNSSPFFKSLPPNFLCANAPLKFDHSAFDADGDSLAYELYTPFLGADENISVPPQQGATNPANYSNVVWDGYSEINQIDGNPILSIDPESGKLTLTPTKTGQFVVGIKVVEYRNGVKIGETKRDFQFNVSMCVFEVVSAFFVPKFNCSGNEVTFSNKSENGTDYFWDFGDPQSKKDTSSARDGRYTYTKFGKYTVNLITKNKNCADTSDYEINVKDNFKAKIPNDTFICGPFNLTLTTNLPGKTYLWNTGQKTPTIKVNKGGTYWVNISDAPCYSRDTMVITNDLDRINLGPDSVICRDSFVQFTWEGKPGYSSYFWSDGTNKQSVFIPALGRYWVHTINKNNCPSSDTITFVLYPPPRVYLNDTLFCKGTSVRLDGVNYSTKTNLETTYEWNTGARTPQINTSKPGLYIVTVRNKLCTIIDSALLTHIETGLELGPDTFYCGPVNRWLIPKKGFVKYRWDDFAETIDYHVTKPGKKRLTITTIEGCVESDSVTISQYGSIDGGLGKDTTICLSALFELAAADSMTDYLWSTGATTRSISIRDSGIYTVTVKNINGCIISDTIKIKEDAGALPIDLFMPNAFSPNNDHLNEFYPGNKYSDPGSPYLFRIYNRWGEKIFEGDKPSVQWDGTTKGDIPAPQDVYVYFVKYVGCDDVERWFRGTFTLLR